LSNVPGFVAKSGPPSSPGSRNTQDATHGGTPSLLGPHGFYMLASMYIKAFYAPVTADNTCRPITVAYAPAQEISCAERMSFDYTTWKS
jgi:hypothetical protein